MPPRDLTSTPRIDPIEDVTRREILKGMLALPILAAGISCGDDDDEPGDEGGNDEIASRTIPHQYGETVINGIPERVVTVGWTEQDALLALGIVPVGTTEWIGEYPGAILPWATDELGDAALPQVLPNGDGIDVEAVAALNPDLIVALYVPSGLTEDEYTRLSQIAPTLAPPVDTPDGGISWRDLAIIVGQAVGQEARAREIVAGVEARFAQAREDYPEFVGATGLNAYPAGDGTFQAYPPPDPGGQLMVELGFVVPEAITELAAGNAWVTISGERADLFDIDVMLWLVEDYTVRDALLANPVYAGLNVAKEGRHVFLAYEEDAALAAATSMQTVLSLPFLIDGLAPKLAAALDGDPATVA